MWVQKKKTVRQAIVCEADPTKKADSAAKRARQAEKRRDYNKSKKSEARTRMKNVVLEAFGGLKKKADAVPDKIVTVEKLIGVDYSSIEKPVGNLGSWRGGKRPFRSTMVGMFLPQQQLQLQKMSPWLRKQHGQR